MTLKVLYVAANMKSVFSTYVLDYLRNESAIEGRRIKLDCAENKFRALKKIDEPYDLVIVEDLSLPSSRRMQTVFPENGLEILKQAGEKKLIGIALTNGEEKRIIRCAKEWADVCLVKNPGGETDHFDAQELYKTIKRYSGF